MQKTVQLSVDKLLLEHGKYLPLELLFLDGRLLVEDYDAWCGGDTQFLDDMLFGDPRQILEQLKEAETYAQALGLQSNVVVYKHWTKDGNPQLVFSSIDELNNCFHKEYARSVDQPQLDLFMDNPVGNLIDGITLALTNQEQSKSRKSIERLYDMAPDHVRLGELECLVSALGKLKLPVDDIKTELKYLQSHIAPAAQAVIGNGARTLLVPYWQRLSEALLNSTFDANQPQLHSSYTAGQAFDWDVVRSEIELEKGWEQQAVLVERHAHACSRLDLRGKAIQSWFYLCWFHSNAETVLNRVGDLEIRNKWKDFLSAEPELPTETFPAWLLLFMPGAARLLPDADNIERESMPASYCIIYDRQKNNGSLSTNPDDDEIQWRSQLREADELLFEHYIASVSNLHV